MSPSKSRGFTLLELMIVITVIAILAIIALPSYFAQVRKSRRSDAIATMNNVVLNEERWRTNCPNYATFNDDYTVDCPLAGVNFMAAPTSAYYTFTITGTSAAGYTINAAPIGSQAKDQQFGTTCGTLKIIVTTTTTLSPSACFGR